MAAKPPTSRKPHVLIVEATYGVMVRHHAPWVGVDAGVSGADGWCWCACAAQTHMPRERRERRFTQVVEDTVLAGGRCLIPVFALGRAQELLLILGTLNAVGGAAKAAGVGCQVCAYCATARRGTLACQRAPATSPHLLPLQVGERELESVPDVPPVHELAYPRLHRPQPVPVPAHLQPAV